SSSRERRKRSCGSISLDLPASPQCRICPARSSAVASPVRRTRSPRPCRMRTELISRSRVRSRATPCAPRSLVDLFCFLRSALVAQRICDPGDYAARQECHASAERTCRFQARYCGFAIGTCDAVCKLVHQCAGACAGLNANVLRMHSELIEFATQILPTCPLGHQVRGGKAVFL